MRLFTRQRYDLRCFPGPVQAGLGRYKDLPKIIAAQKRLYEQLGCDQLVWFSQKPLPITTADRGDFDHEVEVSENDFFAVLNTLVWANIVTPPYVPHGMQIDSERKGEWISKEDFLEKHLPKNIWAAVRIPQIETEDDQVLLAFPFKGVEMIQVRQIVDVTLGGRPTYRNV